MIHRMPLPRLTSQPAKPPPDETDGANSRKKRPAREKQELPNKGDVRRMVVELNAELTGNDKEAAQEAARLCRILSPRAAKRLGLIVTGIERATVLQVNMRANPQGGRRGGQR